MGEPREDWIAVLDRLQAGDRVAFAKVNRLISGFLVQLRAYEMRDDWEGCLSIPDIRGKVPRHVEIRVKGLDRDGERIELRARGFSARIIQHETDHLDGILFFDRMRNFETLTFLDEYSRYWVKNEDDDEE